MFPGEATRALTPPQKGLVLTVYQNRRWDGDFLTWVAGAAANRAALAKGERARWRL